MRVAIEIDYAGGGVRGGTYYVNHLLAELARIDRENEYLVFGFFFSDFERKLAQIKIPDARNFRAAVQRWPQSAVMALEWGWKLPLLESYLKSRGVDVYHCFRPPVWAAGGLAMLVPDITPVVRPEWHDRESMRTWERITRPGLLRARRIITYCRHTQQDIVRELGIPEERVRITRLGIDHALFRPDRDKESLERARAKHSLPARFILMVGPFDVLTGFKTVVEALRLWKASGSPPAVVAVGPVDDYVRGLQAQAEAAGVADLFTWMGYVPHAELAMIYPLADALLHPSRLPGVELPPYEAMACGTPVITSLEENVADAGALIDPDSPSEAYGAMRRVWESGSLREDLRRRGLTRAAEFTWERTARETLQVYRETAG